MNIDDGPQTLPRSDPLQRETKESKGQFRLTESYTAVLCRFGCVVGNCWVEKYMPHNFFSDAEGVRNLPADADSMLVRAGSTVVCSFSCRIPSFFLIVCCVIAAVCCFVHVWYIGGSVQTDRVFYILRGLGERGCRPWQRMAQGGVVIGWAACESARVQQRNQLDDDTGTHSHHWE